MSRIPVERYDIVVHQHPEYYSTETIAMSTYAGETVKGKAICRSEDEYDEAMGVKLAIARCDEKIARKRKARAKKMFEEAEAQYRKASERYVAMYMYYRDASEELEDTQKNLEEILSEM